MQSGRKRIPLIKTKNLSKTAMYSRSYLMGDAHSVSVHYMKPKKIHVCFYTWYEQHKNMHVLVAVYGMIYIRINLYK